MKYIQSIQHSCVQKFTMKSFHAQGALPSCLIWLKKSGSLGCLAGLVCCRSSSWVKKSEKFTQLPRCIYCQMIEYLDTSGQPNELLTPHLSNSSSFRSFRHSWIKMKEMNKNTSLEVKNWLVFWFFNSTSRKKQSLPLLYNILQENIFKTPVSDNTYTKRAHWKQ